MKAKSPFIGAHVEAAQAKRLSPRLTDVQRQFIAAAVARGLGRREVARMFFREFRRDVSPDTVARIARKDGGLA